MSINALYERLYEYLPDDKVGLVRRAYEFAEIAHAGQSRRSGEPYIVHPVETARILGELQLDAAAVAAGLLHDVPEDCGVALSEIEKEFGPEIAKLVDAVTKLTKIAYQARGGTLLDGKLPDEAQAENLRKMLLAMAEDIRVVLIKLADRLHNMRTLSALSPAKRRTIAQETMEIYAPLASRLGIWELKWQLEDLAFRHLEPEKYREIAQLIASRRVARERYIQQVIEILKGELEKAGIVADVSGRPKHIFSVYKKMEKYGSQGKDFSQIYDLLAVRVLVNEVSDCYSALGIVHALWHPIPGQFDDYIAMPKESMYQSLHTNVIGPGGRPLEVQIRTHEMHRVAEYGIAAHWRYKEGARRDIRFEEKIAWLRQLMEWQKELAGAKEFVESVKTDIFRDRVFVYTPRGEIKDLPAGATPIDFAYRIHTDLGHRCIGAKVNGRLVSLDSTLQNGDIVEIVASRTTRGPSRDWLNPALGFIKTSHARDKVRQWFKRQEKAENIERGREMLDKELKRLGLEISVDDLTKLFKYERADDFLAAIGYGEINTQQIANRLAAQQEKPIALPEVSRPASVVASQVQVMGVGDLLTNLAACCTPVPGDEIIGFITRTRGVTIHRRDCQNVQNTLEQERLVRVDWGSAGTGELYPVSVRIDAWDRVGLLRDISTLVSEERVNMSSVSTVSNPDQTATLRITLETNGLAQLSRVLSRLEGVRGVRNVSREVASARAGGAK